MSQLSYDNAVHWLFEQFPSYQLMGSKAFKPTLENTLKLLDCLGNPEKGLKFIHIAGSNGKGSVSSLLASTLTEAGYSTGLFTSPHIVDYTERIRVNGVQIDQLSVIDFVQTIQATELDFAPSFFEMTFALALNHFSASGCDICVIETGLGGRLDATNVISPILSVITTISLEHTDMLGDTLEKIAQEKAGIIKPTGDVVLGKLKPQLYPTFELKAADNGVQSFRSCTVAPFETLMLADYQRENLRTAYTSIQNLNAIGFNSTEHNFERGIRNVTKNTGYRGRLEIVSQSPLTIFDVAHNPEGIEATLSTVQKQNKGNLHVIYGTSADKDLKKISAIFPLNALYYFTQFSNPRSANITDLKKAFSEINLKSTNYYQNSSEALEEAKAQAQENDTILVVGSFFLLSDFF